MLALLTTVAVAAGCHAEPTASEHEFVAAETTITFTFSDYAVPPEPHRDYVLTISGGEGSIVVVDEHGDEQARDEQPVSAEAVEGLLTSYAAGELDAVFALPPETECEGGTRQELTLADEVEEVTARVSPCADTDGEAALLLRDVVDPLEAAFDMSDLTDGRHS